MDGLIIAGLLIIAAAGFMVLHKLDKRSDRRYEQIVGEAPPRDSALRIVIRWIIFLAIGAGLLYGALWIAARTGGI